MGAASYKGVAGAVAAVMAGISISCHDVKSLVPSGREVVAAYTG